MKHNWMELAGGAAASSGRPKNFQPKRLLRKLFLRLEQTSTLKPLGHNLKRSALQH